MRWNERIEIKPPRDLPRMSMTASESEMLEDLAVLESVEDKNPVFKGLLAALLLLAMGAVFMVGAVTVLVWIVSAIKAVKAVLQ